MASPTQGAADNRSLQELAVDVVQDIHKLATGLAHAGAPPNVTQQIEKTSELYGAVAKALASGPVGAQTPGGGPPQAGPPPGPPSAPPSPGTPQTQAPAHGDLHNAIAQMHHDSVNAAARTAPR